MSQSANLALAQEFLGRLGEGKSEEIGELFAKDLVWEVPVDDSALRWIGKFGIILTITEGKVSRFQMLEDSFAISKVGRS